MVLGFFRSLLTPKRRARSWVKTTHPATAAMARTTTAMAMPPPVETIFCQLNLPLLALEAKKKKDDDTDDADEEELGDGFQMLASVGRICLFRCSLLGEKVRHAKDKGLGRFPLAKLGGYGPGNSC